MNKIYRPCAGIVVFNNDGLLFLGNRVGIENSWQFPQGGIEKNETILEAAKRELFEETGIKSVIHVYTEDMPIRYEFNGKIKSNFRKKGIFNDGQEIYFSLFYFNGSDSEINLKVFEQEFDKYKWDTFDFAINNIIDFKKDVYLRIAKKFMPIIEQYLEAKS